MRYQSIVFWVTLAISQIVGVLISVLIVYWRQAFYCGFDIGNAPRLLNLHSVLMVVGYVVLFGEALLLLRMCYSRGHRYMLLVHVLLNCASLSLGVAGLGAAIFFYQQTDKVGFYSLHSWLGVCLSVSHALQSAIGFAIVYAVHKEGRFKDSLFRLNTSFGVIVLCFAAATCLMGLTRVNFLDAQYSQLSLPTLYSNVLGMLIVVYVGLISALILHHADQPQETDDISLNLLREDEDKHTKTH